MFMQGGHRRPGMGRRSQIRAFLFCDNELKSGSRIGGFPLPPPGRKHQAGHLRRCTPSPVCAPPPRITRNAAHAFAVPVHGVGTETGRAFWRRPEGGPATRRWNEEDFRWFYVAGPLASIHTFTHNSGCPRTRFPAEEILRTFLRTARCSKGSPITITSLLNVWWKQCAGDHEDGRTVWRPRGSPPVQLPYSDT
jgi:hypothetical protein